MSDTVQVTHDDRAVTIAFHRPEKYNALDVEMSRALADALTRAVDTPLPVVLRSSTPGMFVSGTDMVGLRARTVDESLGRINSRLMDHVWEYPWPTVAVVDGPALGGGCELALACDLRIASTRSSWGLPEVRLGLVPSAGGLTRLPRVVGSAVATELILTGRRLDGVEAGRVGLANAVVEPEALDSTVDGLLDELSHASPRAARLAKEALRVQGDPHRLVDATAQALCLADPDTQARLDRAIRR